MLSRFKSLATSLSTPVSRAKTPKLRNTRPQRPHSEASVDKRNYATDRVHTPMPTTSSNEGLNNNPAITFVRKNKKSTVVQHPEWVKDYCDKPGCTGKICIGLCGEKTSSKSIAHFTHSEDDKHKAQKLADTDLDGNNKPIYAKSYENPHETTSESYDPEGDKEKTKKLQEQLKNIQNGTD